MYVVRCTNGDGMPSGKSAGSRILRYHGVTSVITRSLVAVRYVSQRSLHAQGLYGYTQNKGHTSRSPPPSILVCMALGHLDTSP
jgi:hypothetical protein